MRTEPRNIRCPQCGGDRNSFKRAVHPETPLTDECGLCAGFGYVSHSQAMDYDAQQREEYKRQRRER